MLDRALALALEPAQVMVEAGLPPDPWQREVLASDSKRNLLLCSRQAGKSTVAAALAIHEAIFRPPALVLMLSPSLRQSAELFRKAAGLHPLFADVGPVERETVLTLQLKNGSRIVSLPSTEGTIRGYSGVKLLIVDEAARVPEELYFAVRPMLAVSDGRLVAMSTPYGKRGWFFEAWSLGGPEWSRTKIAATECPRIPPEFLDAERASTPPRVFAQEYLCEFADTEDACFDYDTVMAAVTDDVLPLDLEEA